MLLVPVSDYRQFLDQFHPDKPDEKVVEVKAVGKVILVAKRGLYDPGSLHRKALQTMLDFKRGINADLADLRPWLEENEVAGVVTTQGVKVVCARGIETVHHVQEVLPSVRDEKLRACSCSRQNRREKMWTMVQEEVSSVALGGHVDSEGVLQVSNRIQLSADGKVDRLLGASSRPRPIR